MYQFVAYFIGGSSYFWSGYATFALLYGALQVEWWLAKGVADLVGWSLNFVLQRYWAFNSPDLRQHEAEVRWRYVIVTALNFGIDYAIVGGLRLLGVSPFIGLFVAAGFFTVWNYVWYKWFVFRASRL
jgi:putative flippase GtrA